MTYRGFLLCDAANCREIATGTDLAGNDLCSTHVLVCDSDHAPAPLDAEGVCRVCDPCRCGEESTDPTTGYVSACPLHAPSLPVPDALARLRAAMGV